MFICAGISRRISLRFYNKWAKKGYIYVYIYTSICAHKKIMVLPLPIVMKLRIFSRSLQTCPAQTFFQIELKHGHTQFHLCPISEPVYFWTHVDKFLLNWGWGIPGKSLWHRFWDTLYIYIHTSMYMRVIKVWTSLCRLSRSSESSVDHCRYIPQKKSTEIEIKSGHTISFMSSHISLHQISRNSGKVSGITWRSCTKILWRHRNNRK